MTDLLIHDMSLPAPGTYKVLYVYDNGLATESMGSVLVHKTVEVKEHGDLVDLQSARSLADSTQYSMSVGFKLNEFLNKLPIVLRSNK